MLYFGATFLLTFPLPIKTGKMETHNQQFIQDAIKLCTPVNVQGVKSFARNMPFLLIKLN